MLIKNTSLKDYFPMIRTREEILTDIEGNSGLHSLFHSWKEEQQEEFLNFCTGAKGVKILYDSFFKEILNPEAVPQRLEDWLSLLLGQRVRILNVLPNDSVRIADENSLLITDIVVEMENGCIANVEVQKVGYHFPGQRSACYSADLLLRQYKRVKDEDSKRERKFSYKDIKDVYTIVLYEKSPKEFKDFPDVYIHRSQQRVDSGLELELLQKYIFIPLDIFKKTQHNKPISNKLDAWLTFFCAEKPEEILQLITQFPEFRPLYEDIYELCRNTEKVMSMFSKELLELDRNTVQYMIDEMQDTIDEQKGKLEEQQGTIYEQKDTINEQRTALEERDAEIEALKKELKELKK